jgi:hypothetical protein
MPIPDDVKARNRKLGWILASVAAAFMVGFVVRLSFFGG